MRALRQSARNTNQKGSALLIAIFALLLISVVGIALLISTGTDSALAGNYRTSTTAYYAALAGLEEARGRLLWRNPNFINSTNAYPTLFTAQGNPSFGLNDVLYIINPAGGETVNPLDSTSPYADQEYGTEGGVLGSANVQTIQSVSPLPSPSLPGPAFKWVRINAVTEKSINLDIDNHGAYDPLTLLYYGGTGLYRPGSGIPSPQPAGNEALEITAFAYMPDKSTKLLQYLVAPNSLLYALGPGTLNQNLPAALILAGNTVTYAGPDSTSFFVSGNDPTTGRTCTAPPLPAVYAIGYTTSFTGSGGFSTHAGNYQGSPPLLGPATPSVGQVTMPVTLQKPSQLDALVQDITQNADVVIPGPANGANFTSLGMVYPANPNPVTVVVNGDLDLNFAGFGLLLVTGNLNFDPNASWTGIVLVIGKGTVTSSPSATVSVTGTMLVAQDRDPVTNNLLPDPTLGNSSVNLNIDSVGNGIYYNSCSILQALAPTSYSILSFREITPP